MPVVTGVVGYTSLTQQVRLVLENNGAGEQVLMALSTGTSTMSLTTQPNTISATTGMHLHIFVIGNSAAGTITIAGNNVAGGPQTSITYHVPVAPQNQQGYTDFTTTEIWSTVSASGITLSSLTPCQIIIFGSYAGKYLLPISSDVEEKVAKFSPQDRRGILFKNFRVQQLVKTVDVGKFDCTLYPDSLWAPYMLIGTTPAITTVPATATTKLASTSVSGTMTLTTGPSAPGEFLIFAVTTNTASGTIVLSGTDIYGNAASETITATSGATQTLYSTKRYATLTSNQFTTTGLTSSHIAVTGVFAWTYTWTYDGVTNYTPYSAGISVYNGVHGVNLPGVIFTDGTWSWAKEKEISFTAKGEAQDYCIVGDSTPTSTANYLSGANPFPTITQPTSLPIVSWPANLFIDSLPGTPLTTQDGHLVDLKVGIVTGQKYVHVGDGFQRPAFSTFTAESDFTCDGTIIWQNYTYYETYFKSNQKLALGVSFQGNLLGRDSTSTYYEGPTWTLPIKIETIKVDYSKNPVEAVIKFLSEYDFGLGYAYKYAVTTQVPPTYTK